MLKVKVFTGIESIGVLQQTHLTHVYRPYFVHKDTHLKKKGHSLRLCSHKKMFVAIKLEAWDCLKCLSMLLNKHQSTLEQTGPDLSIRLSEVKRVS